MEWAEIDALLWLFLALKAIEWLVKVGTAYAQAKGWLPDNIAQGILTFAV